MGRPAKVKTKTIAIPVAYGNVSFDDRAAHLPITIRRGEIDSPSIHDADRNLCGRQITASIVARPEGAAANQPGMFGDDGDLQIDGLFQIGSLTVSPKQINATLKIALDKLLDRDRLTHFAKREGLLVIEHVHELAGVPSPTPAVKEEA